MGEGVGSSEAVDHPVARGTVRLAAAGEIEVLADCLGRAFAADPLMGWIYRDHAARAEHVRQWWHLGLALALGHHHTYTEASAAGCAIWAPPGVELFEGEAVVRLMDLLGRQLGPDLERVVTGLMVVDEARPQGTPCHYLFGLGVVPEHQGRGLGAELLAPVLEKADRRGVPAYLESSNPRNVPFYERHGFEVIAEVQLPDGPTVRPMWRPVAG